MARRRFTKRVRSVLGLLAGLGLLSVALIVSMRTPTAEGTRDEAQRLRRAGNPEAALVALERAEEYAEAHLEGAERDAEKVLLRIERGRCNLELGRTQHALEDLRESRRLAPDDPERWLDEGAAYLQFGRFEEAAQLYQDASEQFDDRATTFRYAAGCAWFQQSRQEADLAFEALSTRVALERSADLRDVLDSFVAGTITMTSQEVLDLGLAADSFGLVAQNVRSAQRAFVRARELLADYPTFAEMEPASGSIVAELLRRTGDVFAMKQLTEVLLLLHPGGEESIPLRSLLANILFDLEAYEEAGRLFRANRAELRRAKRTDEFRRSGFFAVEAYLRADKPEPALSLLDSDSILAANNPLNLFYLAYARHLNGEAGAAEKAADKAVRLLDVQRFGKRNWYRNRDHQAWILDGLYDILIAADRPVLLRTVVEAATRLFPDASHWTRRRLETPGTGTSKEEDLLTLLRGKARSRSDFERWRVASAARWKIPEELERQVAWQARRVLNLYATRQLRAPMKGTDAFLERTRRSRSRGDRAAQSAREASSSALLGELTKDPYLALEVHHHLTRESQRAQSYLVLLGIAAVEPEILQFRALVAEREYADGRLDQAAESWLAVFEADPTDWRSAERVWDIYRALGRLREAKMIEARLIALDPEGAGRFIAARSALADGFPAVAERIARGADPTRDVGAAALGVHAAALLNLSQAGEAESTARRVFEAHFATPSVLSSLTAAIVELRGVDQGMAFLGRHDKRLRTLTADQLATIGRALSRRRALRPADFVLRLALELDPGHVPARTDRVDALIGLKRYDEAEEQLLLLEEVAALDVDLERRALLELLSRDANACYTLLRDWTARGAGGAVTERWLALTGAATGRLSTALRSLPGVPDEDTSRFLALQLAIADDASSLIDAKMPPSVRRRWEGLRTPTEARDRHLEVLVSLEMIAEERGALSRDLLPLLLLRDAPHLDPLLEQLERAFVQQYPSVGRVALDRVRRLDRAGRRRTAGDVLLTHLRADPGHDEALGLLVTWSGDLQRDQIEEILDGDGTLRLPAGPQKLLEGLSLLGQDSDAARGTLLEAADLLDEPGLALALLLDLEQRRIAGLRTSPFRRTPTQEMQHRRAVELAATKYRALFDDYATDHPGDPHLPRAYLRYLETFPEPLAIGPESSVQLLRWLSVGALHEWGAYRIAAAILDSEATGLDPVQRIAVSLRAAMKDVPPAQLQSMDLVHALADLGSALTRLGDPVTARRLFDHAQRICPYDAHLLAQLADAESAPGRAAEIRQLAVACGHDDPDDLAWMARHLYEQVRDLDGAERFADRAVDACTSQTAAEVEADALRQRARLHSIRGRVDAAVRDHEAASARLGEDPDLDYGRALELTLGRRRGPALNALGALIETDHPHRDLCERLLAAITPSSTEASDP